MAIFRRTTASELPESQIEYNDTSGARRWIALALYILMALVVAILVVMAGRWVYHKLHNTSETRPVPVAPEGVSSTPAVSPPNASKVPSGSSNTKKVPNPPNPSPTPSRTAPSPQALPSNGPGDVLALFVGVSLAAAGLHYAVAIKRA
jgi:hypothetical protein